MMTGRTGQILTSAILLCLVIPCPAYVIAQPHVFSLWSSEDMTACDVYIEEPYMPFTVYVFIEPGADGMFAVEYKLEILPGHYSTDMTLAPFVSGAALGTWTGPPGISAPFTECQTGLTWIVHFTMMAPDVQHGFYTFGANDDTGELRVAICSGTRPFEPVVADNVFGYNHSCMWYHANEETSWGAIKDMYRR